MKLPEVSANFALSIDGNIAARGKGLTSFTSARDRRRMLELRAESDAILVGRGTLEADDMPLRLPSAKLRARRTRAGKSAEPLRVVVSNSGRLRKNLRIFRGGAPIIVFSTKSMPAATRLWLEKVADVRLEPRAKRVDLRRAMAVLARDYGVRSVLCEGGAEVFRALAESRLVAKLHITFAPVIIGGADAPTLLGPARTSLLRRSIPLRLQSFRPIGAEAFATYRFGAAS
ncbi:MAG: RibD family protein [Chthoniobacterales bacterium]